MKLKKTRVGVLRGGPSSEHEVSLKTGANVLKGLPEKYQGIDIYIDREGVWHIDGLPIEPQIAAKRVDVFFNAMHGEYGEDGKVQAVLDFLGVPYTGSKTFASALGMNKAMTKNFVMREGVKSPAFKVVRREEMSPATLIEIYRTLPHPVVVKPMALGSSVGVSIATTMEEVEKALTKVFERSDAALVEEMIKGREATCGVIDDFRGERHYALLPIEIIPPQEATFFDYEAKYGGKTQEICPGNFTPEESRQIQEIAKKVHKILNLRHYSRSDFIVTPKRGIHFLEVNTLPGLTSESLMPKAIKAVGSSYEELLEHLITLALTKK